ncbi:23S rRNA (uracil(1939)-C(5))-methyltransferase RlmD [Weissella soli]|uniref:23S rRNA (uracil(1939)-C(5))-methyltransferase RlmD n=1 Tax=Weissella soli TaxID=155866 RepID=UPI0021BEAA5E|nr:23S rRNA (uracil(1939)-C(5))-methyltransferase RlmD [Weissella soli]MCT8394369.1 23S rRNA (uracil(1939)-C(5))-methyltransferase RlmD [Weissella soli]
MPKNILPVKLHEIREGVVTDVMHNGMGVILVDDYPVKLVDAFLGEKIKYELTQVDRLSAFGQVLQVLEPSPERIQANKDYLLEAGVAPYVNLSYQGQLRLKKWQVEKAFAAVGLDTIAVADTIGTTHPTHYRNKTVVPMKYQNGKLTTGFFDRKDKVTIVPMEDYFVNDREIDAAIGMVRDILDAHQVTVYDDATQKGDMRYIMVRRGYYSHEVMVVLVSHSPALADEEPIAQEIAAKVPGIQSIILNHNPRQTNQQLTGDNRTLWGADAIHDTLLGRDFVIGPNSFYQVNPETTEVLYELAAQKGELQGSDTIIDAYSGIGTIGLSVADKVQRVLGVEVVERAVADAKINMVANQIKNAEFVAADAPTQMQAWKDAGLKPDVVFVDPPRRGLTEELMDAVTYMKPDRFVYVSCNPVTMARDTTYMLEHGYALKGAIQPLDQFPQTAHIEAVALFVPQAMATK